MSGGVGCGGGGGSLSFQEKEKKGRNVERFSFHLVWRCQVENVHLSPGDFYVRLGSGDRPRGVLFLACSQWSPFAGDRLWRSKPFERDIKHPPMIFDGITAPSRGG